MDTTQTIGAASPEQQDACAETLLFQRIIEGIKHGETRAALLLYDHFGTLVNRVVGKLLGVDQDHDDIVQQVFLNVLQSIGKVRNPAALKGWIMTLAINTVRRELRSRKYRRIFGLLHEIPEEQPAQDGNDPEQKLFVNSFYQVMNRLGAEERIIFTLYYVEEQTLDELAVSCNCSLSTVKRRIASAKRIFMKHAMNDPVLCSMLGGEARDG